MRSRECELTSAHSVGAFHITSVPRHVVNRCNPLQKKQQKQLKTGKEVKIIWRGKRKWCHAPRCVRARSPPAWWSTSGCRRRRRETRDVGRRNPSLPLGRPSRLGRREDFRPPARLWRRTFMGEERGRGRGGGADLGARLTHEVSTLDEEVAALPLRIQQTRLAEKT